MKKLFYPPLSLLVVFVMLLGGLTSTIAFASKTFTDYKPGDMGYEEVQYLVGKDIVRGLPNNRFAPNVPVSREDSAVMFQRALDLQPTTRVSPFKDITNRRDYFYDAVIATYEAGIFGGDTKGNFGVKGNLTREQMASVIVRAFDLKPNSGKITLTDLDMSHSVHRKDIEILNQLGIAKGRTGGIFDPKSHVTRAEFSLFLHRAIHLDPDTNPDPSNGGGAGGIGSGGGEADTTAPLATAATLTLSNGKTIVADIIPGRINRLEFDLRGEANNVKFQSGTINVTEDSVIQITNIPASNVPNTDTLTEGPNSLSVAEALAGQDVLIGSIRTAYGNYILAGTLKDESGNSTVIHILLRTVN
ncbi:S-layer homology domain-containing protein [Evansella sp. AB-rgal1]|uniref:S-layer homology domain-containing protein n=1 Tax=Evansella sp. AB-rgal1 TaxID=3242696 RepID=UPI00359E3A6C